VGEGGGFVEAGAGFRMRRILSRVTLNLLEEPEPLAPGPLVCIDSLFS
jgi:hypothetical protein